jgi:serine/threonine-protein kinase
MSAIMAIGDSFYDDINLACERFEAAWRSGAQPQIEPYIAEAPEGARPELICELLKLDIYYRRDRGDTILPSDYQSYPEHATLIATLLAERVPPEQSSELTHAGRYRLEGRIGQGGMGVVYRAHDPDFHRPLAVKILKEEYKDRPHMVARFLEEAKITGQLQHPGVPPVHEIGRLADGRPFLAMKLIEGRTLADLLSERNNPADGMPRILLSFEQVCQAVAYAHSRRVIHRDLKPANVMVADSCEVQVMDWGLAKTIARADEHYEAIVDKNGNTLFPLQLETIPNLTQPGQLLGTLAYMPPEQARGEIDRMGERSDVFSLGAMLCEILTGEPPYREPSPEIRLERAQSAALADAFARLQACGADPELIALTKKCLASDVVLRPKDAGDVAKAMAAYQDEVQQRLRRAELQRAAAEVKTREERKRRRVTVALAATAILLVVLGGGVAWWVHEDRSQMRNEVQAGIAQARDMQKQARWDEAEAALILTANRLGSGGPIDLRQMLEQAQKDVTLAKRVDKLWLEFDLEGNWSAWTEEYLHALREYGLDLESDSEESLAHTISTSAIQDVVITALDALALVSTDERRSQRLLSIAYLVDKNPTRAKLIQNVKTSSRIDLWQDEEFVRELDVNDLTPQLILAGAISREFSGKDGSGLLERAHALHLQDVQYNLWLGHFLCWFSDDPSTVRSGLFYLQRAVGLRPVSGQIASRFAEALYKACDLEGELAHFRLITSTQPENRGAWRSMSDALIRKGEFAAAAAACRHSYRNEPGEIKFNPGERLLDMERRLPAILENRDITRSVQEHIDLLRMLYYKGHYVLCYRFSAKLFAEAPEIASWKAVHNSLPDQRHDPRYIAACAAVLSAAGLDRTEIDLDDYDRARRRQQALEWLRASLAEWKVVQYYTPFLQVWLADPALMGVRDMAALANLPQAERKEWQMFWDEVRPVARSVRRPVVLYSK